MWQFGKRCFFCKLHMKACHLTVDAAMLAFCRCLKDVSKHLYCFCLKKNAPPLDMSELDMSLWRVGVGGTIRVDLDSASVSRWCKSINWCLKNHPHAWGRQRGWAGQLYLGLLKCFMSCGLSLEIGTGIFSVNS